MIAITDPSSEIAEMAERFKAVHLEHSTERVIAETLGLNPGSADMMEAIATIGERLERLRAFSAAVQDDLMRPELRREMDVATRTILRMLESQHLVQPWSHSKQQWLGDTHINTLRWFSMIARRHRPLAKPSAHELEQLLGAINDADATVDEIKEEHWWIRDALKSGLRRIEIRVRYLTFFGYDTLHRELVVQAHSAQSIEATVGGLDFQSGKGSSEAGNQSLRNSLNKYATVMVLVASVIEAPHKTAETIRLYHENGWKHYTETLTKIIPKMLEGIIERKLLAPPAKDASISDEARV